MSGRAATPFHAAAMSARAGPTYLIDQVAGFPDMDESAAVCLITPLGCPALGLSNLCPNCS